MQVIPFFKSDKNEDAAYVFVYLIRRLIDRLIKAPPVIHRSYLNGSCEGRLHPELVLSFFDHLVMN